MDEDVNRSVAQAGLPSGSGRKRWRWLPSSLLLLLFSPILVAVIWYVGVRIANSRAVSRLEMEIRQQGQPVTLAELQAIYPPIPDEQNVAMRLLALWEKEDPAFWAAFRTGSRPILQSRKRAIDPGVPILGSKAAAVVRGVKLDDDALAAAKEYLKQEADHLAEVHDALRHRQARFPLKFDEGNDMLMPHLAAMKGEAQNFRLAALVAAEEGNVSASFTALQDVARVGQVLSGDPIVISHLVRIACVAIAVGGVEDVMCRHSLDAAQLTQLKGLLDEMRIEGGLKQSLLGERAFALGVFADNNLAASLSSSENMLTEGRGQKFAIGAMKVIGLAAADKRLMLETYKPAIAMADDLTPENLRAIQAVFREAGVKCRQFPPKIFSGMMLPSMERLPFKFAALEARRRSGLVAVAIAQYRLQHSGQPPETLQHLVPQYLSEVLTDPFDGEPLRYQIRPKGYVVYSIGADGNDDGAAERKPSRNGPQSSDEIFVVEH